MPYSHKLGAPFDMSSDSKLPRELLVPNPAAIRLPPDVSVEWPVALSDPADCDPDQEYTMTPDRSLLSKHAVLSFPAKSRAVCVKISCWDMLSKDKPGKVVRSEHYVCCLPSGELFEIYLHASNWVLRPRCMVVPLSSTMEHLRIFDNALAKFPDRLTPSGPHLLRIRGGDEGVRGLPLWRMVSSGFTLSDPWGIKRGFFSADMTSICVSPEAKVMFYDPPAVVLQVNRERFYLWPCEDEFALGQSSNPASVFTRLPSMTELFGLPQPSDDRFLGPCYIVRLVAPLLDALGALGVPSAK